MPHPINRIAQFYDSDEPVADALLAEFTDTAIDFTESGGQLASESEPLDQNSVPIARLLDLILNELHTTGAYRVFIVPLRDTVSIRFDVGGDIVERDCLPHQVFHALVKRIDAGKAATPALECVVVIRSTTEFGQAIELKSNDPPTRDGGRDELPLGGSE